MEGPTELKQHTHSSSKGYIQDFYQNVNDPTTIWMFMLNILKFNHFLTSCHSHGSNFKIFFSFFAETTVTFSMIQHLSPWKQVVTQYDLILDFDHPLIVAICCFLDKSMVHYQLWSPALPDRIPSESIMATWCQASFRWPL